MSRPYRRLEQSVLEQLGLVRMFLPVALGTHLAGQSVPDGQYQHALLGDNPAVTVPV